MYRADFANSGAVPGPSAVRSPALHPLWSYRADSRMTSSPTIVNNLVYVGTWNGDVLALDTRTGALRWKRSLGANQDTYYGGRRGVIGSVAVDRGVAYAVSGSCTAAAYAADNGRELWRRRICSTEKNDDTYASPVVFWNELLLGIDQIGDRPTSRGFEVALDTRTGRELWRFYPQRYQGTGAGISATPAIDGNLGLAFIGTGNPTPLGNPPPGADEFSESICALDLRDGHLIWAYGPVHPHDREDNDLFASANIFTATIDGARRHLVGEGGKDDVYYAVDERTGALVWKRTLIPRSKFAMIIGTAAVGAGTIFVPVFQNEHLGWMVALRSSDGAELWSKRMTGVYEAPVLLGDVLFVTEAGGWIDALDARNGKSLGQWPIERPVLGRGPSMAGDTLYLASGNTLRAFALSHS